LADWQPIDGDDQITTTEQARDGSLYGTGDKTRLICRTTRYNFRDICSIGVVGKTKYPYRFQVPQLIVQTAHAKIGVVGIAVADDSRNNPAKQIDGNGEPNARIGGATIYSEGFGLNGAIDPDHLAGQIQERATRVSWINRGISLDQIAGRKDPVDTRRSSFGGERAPDGRDDSHRHRSQPAPGPSPRVAVGKAARQGG
jgi:hypothetical protein